jgi:hypothetical protein
MLFYGICPKHTQQTVEIKMERLVFFLLGYFLLSKTRKLATGHSYFLAFSETHPNKLHKLKWKVWHFLLG